MTVLARTDRISLRVPSVSDIGPLTDLWADPETMRYIGQGEPWTAEKVRERVERAIECHREHRVCFWTVVRNEDDAVLGQAGVVPISFNGPEFELGYRLGREHWGQGYATEAARLAADHAMAGVGLDRLVAVTYPENTASRKVLSKVGFRESGLSDKYYGVRCMTFELTPGSLAPEPIVGA